jgi:N,N'-diacetyllegionaminate synthase
MNLGKHTIGTDSCFIIAEAGVNHNGDVDMAKQLIAAAASAGANAVKFQLFDPEEISVRDAPVAHYQEGAGQNQRDMLQGLMLPKEAYGTLKMYAELHGLVFIVTPFDIASAVFLVDLGVAALKIPSGEATHHQFLKRIATLGVPVILSTGTCSLDEVADAVAIFQKIDLALLHCTSAYPTPLDQVHLRAMQTLRERFSVPVGLSDHTEGIAVPLAAVALGACILEKHFTISRTLVGPDHKASLEPQELKAMIDGIRAVEAALGSGMKLMQPSEENTAAVARRSIVAATDLQEGDVLCEEHLTFKRPGTGIPPKDIQTVLGMTLTKPIKEGTPLRYDHFQ